MYAYTLIYTLFLCIVICVFTHWDEYDTFSDFDENTINLTHLWAYADELNFIRTLQNFENGLCMLCQNLRRWAMNCKSLLDNVSRSSNMSIICQQETWLSIIINCNTSLYQILGYTLMLRRKSAHVGLISLCSLFCK